MMPGGRPEKEIDIRQVRRLASLGLTQEQIAASLGVHPETLIRRKKKYSEFLDALKEGQAQGISTIANALYDNARAGETAAQIFYLKARAGWSDKLQIIGDANNPVHHVVSERSLTAEEWEKEYGDGAKKND